MEITNIAAVIVCFNPDIKRLLANVFSIYKQIDQLIIIDNNSLNFVDYSDQILVTLPSEFRNVFIKNDANLGIAKSLNIAIDYCIEHNFAWLLTLDQDSCCDVKMISELFKNGVDKNVGMLAPKVIDINNPKSREYRKSEEHSISYITSGSVINVKTAKAIGGFAERLFIDYVDHEFCFRLLVAGYKINYEHDALLYHEIGKTTMHHFLGRKLYTTNHAPFRYFFLFRNRTYVNKKYFFHFPGWVIRDILKESQTILFIILFERNKFSKLSNVFNGIFAGLFNLFDNISHIPGSKQNALIE